jgi:hypothetical protein
MRITLTILYFLFLSLLGKGQTGEKFTVMHYNLLYYGVYTSFCTSSNNNVDLKDGNLSIIIEYVQPDVLTVNELGIGPSGTQDPANLNRILDNVLNASGEPRFSAAPYTNTTNSTIVNGLFYDNTKFVFHHGEVIANVVRDINLYSLYIKDEDMLLAGDTIFLHAIVAHLKAGSSMDDQNRRTQEIQTVMSYISQKNLHGNIMFLADFNMQSSLEFAYQHLTFNVNQDIRFNDPINEPGTWWNNPDFAQLHTQSTHTVTNCFIGGGLDDRFDQILVTNPIISGTQGLKYVESSYYALGQDGQRFNQSLISPPNLSAPPDVINALYNMSDHLPVILEIERVELPSSVTPVLAFEPQLFFANPARESLNLEVRNINSNALISIFSLSGQLLKSFPISADQYPAKFSLNILDLNAGMYFVRLEGNGFLPVTNKLLIIN